MIAASHPTGPSSAWAPLRIPVFRTLFIAQLVSNIGLWMQTVGAQWFLVERHSGATVVALAQTASLLPTMFLALPAGGLADLLDRRRLLITVSSATAVAASVTTLLAWTDVLTPRSLLVMTFLLGCGSSLSAPAWQAIQPELVPHEQIPAASALGSVTVNGARAVGPAIGGVLVAVAGPAAVFAVNSLTFVAVVAALVVWRRPDADPEVHRARLGRSLLTGVHYVRSAPIVRRILLRSVLFTFPASALWALLPLASAQELHLGASGYGGVLGLLGAGGVGGVALYPALRRRLAPNGILALSGGLYALGVLTLVLLPTWVILPMLVVAGGAWIGTVTTLNASLQLSLAGWVRARGLSVYLLVFMGAQALGSFFWGVLASHTTVRTALLAAAALMVVSAVSIRALPLHPATGTLARGVSTAWPHPSVVFEPEADDGPVLVVHTFRVSPEAADAFDRAMVAVGLARRRTGGYGWGLYRVGSDPHLRVEQFTAPSWAEFERQHHDRWTDSDHDLMVTALRHTITGAVESEQHLLALRSRPGTSLCRLLVLDVNGGR